MNTNGNKRTRLKVKTNEPKWKQVNTNKKNITISLSYRHTV
jgi:hypothetical protein